MWKVEIKVVLMMVAELGAVNLKLKKWSKRFLEQFQRFLFFC